MPLAGSATAIGPTAPLGFVERVGPGSEYDAEVAWLGARDRVADRETAARSLDAAGRECLAEVKGSVLREAQPPEPTACWPNARVRRRRVTGEAVMGEDPRDPGERQIAAQMTAGGRRERATRRRWTWSGPVAVRGGGKGGGGGPDRAQPAREAYRIFDQILDGTSTPGGDRLCRPSVMISACSNPADPLSGWTPKRDDRAASATCPGRLGVAPVPRAGVFSMALREG